MNKQMKACMTPHVMLHSLFGLGLGLLISAVFSLTGTGAIVLGLLFMVVAILGDMRMANKKNKK